jgi:hypothetical protein
MAEEYKMHDAVCNCGCESGMMGHIGRKNRYKLLKAVVFFIFMFMAFSVGVHLGQIKGALGISPFPRYYNNYMPMRGGYQPVQNQQQPAPLQSAKPEASGTATQQ